MKLVIDWKCRTAAEVEQIIPKFFKMCTVTTRSEDLIVRIHRDDTVSEDMADKVMEAAQLLKKNCYENDCDTCCLSDVEQGCVLETMPSSWELPEVENDEADE